jgi:hypothetical protein
MKKIITLSFFLLLAAGFVTINSCTSEPLIVSYGMSDQTLALTADPLAQHYQIFTFDVHHADVVSALTAAGITDVSRATKAALKTGFKATVPVGSNLDAIGNIEVYMKQLGSGGTGDQVAYSDAIGTGATEVNLLVNGNDIKLAVTNDVTFTVKVLNKTAISAQNLTLTNGFIDVSVRK